MVQILVEAGWSMVAFDYATIFGYYGLVMLYFVVCHLLTVLIISSLLKGLVWEVYSSVNEEYKNRRNKFRAKRMKEEEKERQIKEIDEIREQFKTEIQFNRLSIVPNTILRKELYENKIDLQIIAKLRRTYSQMYPNKRTNRS